MLFVIWGKHRINSIYVIVLADWFNCDASPTRETNRVHDGLLKLEVPRFCTNSEFDNICRQYS
jgi:hypothetical protein